MNTNAAVDVQEVKAVLVDALDLADREGEIGPDTRLLGAIPELDSMAVLTLVTALEQRFAIRFDGDDVTADAFETLDSLAGLVNSKRT